jgi:hypothetical protein
MNGVAQARAEDQTGHDAATCISIMLDLSAIVCYQCAHNGHIKGGHRVQAHQQLVR